MKYTINGYSQEALIKNDLDLIDSLILRTLSDMYSSNSKKIDYKILEYEVKEEDTGETKKDKDKFMWVKYGYLFEQIPIIGSERTLVRKIDELIKNGFLKKQVLNNKNGVRGTFLYISFGKNYSEITEYEIEEGMPNCHGGYAKLSWGGMPNCHGKDSSIIDSSITSKNKIKKEKTDHTEKLLAYIEDLKIDTEKKEIFKEWVEYKKSKGQYKDTKSLDILIKRFIKYSVQELRDIVEKSIMNNYSGIFEPKEINKTDQGNNNEISKMTPEERERMIKAKYFGGA